MRRGIEYILEDDTESLGQWIRYSTPSQRTQEETVYPSGSSMKISPIFWSYNEWRPLFFSRNTKGCLTAEAHSWRFRPTYRISCEICSIKIGVQAFRFYSRESHGRENADQGWNFECSFLSSKQRPHGSLHIAVLDCTAPFITALQDAYGLKPLPKFCPGCFS